MLCINLLLFAAMVGIAASASAARTFGSARTRPMETAPAAHTAAIPVADAGYAWAPGYYVGRARIWAGGDYPRNPCRRRTAVDHWDQGGDCWRQ